MRRIGMSRRTLVVALVVLSGLLVAGTVFAYVRARETPPGKLLEHPTGVSEPTRALQPAKVKPPARRPGAIAESCWTTFGRTTQRTSNASDLQIGLPGRVLWRRRLGSLIEFPPSYCDGVLYANTFKGFTYAVDALTGKVIWKRKTGTAPFDVTPAIAGQRLIIGGKDGYITALDRSNGTTLWRLRTAGPVESSPVVIDDRIYIASHDGRIYSIFLTTGKIDWAYQSNGTINGSPSVDDGKVYIANYAGEVMALRRSSGRLVWRRTYHIDPLRSERFYATVAIDNNRAYITSVGGNVYAINADSGREIWKRHIGPYIYASPAVADDVIIFGAFDGRVYALRKKNGKQAWSERVDGDVSGTGVVIGKHFYVSTLERTTYALNVSSGNKVWRHDFGKYVPGIATERAFYFSLHGLLIAFAAGASQ